jgi:hypothetical protein
MTREELVSLIRQKAAQGNRLLVAALLNVLNGGSEERARYEELVSIEKQARARSYLTAAEVQRTQAITAAILHQLGYDPRTEEAPARRARVTVPPSESVRQALLAGDADRMVSLVLEARRKGRLWAATGASV